MSRGFTLVEMVTVIVILGITAAAALPAFVRLASPDPLADATLRVEGILQEARATALSRATTITVTLTPESGRFWVSSAEGGNVDSGVISLGPGIRLESPSARPAFRFDRLGVTDGDSLLVLGSTGARAIVVDRWARGVRDEAR